MNETKDLVVQLSTKFDGHLAKRNIIYQSTREEGQSRMEGKYENITF